jgi:beta-glucanase (GH16 family)
VYTDDRPGHQTPPSRETRRREPSGEAKRRGPGATAVAVSSVIVVLIVLGVAWAFYHGSWKLTSVTLGPSSSTNSPPSSSTDDSQAAPIGGRAKKVNIAPPSTWKLAFNSDFAGSALDTNVWTTCYKYTSPGDGCTNHGNSSENDWYLPSQDQVSGGMLQLIAQHEPTEGTSASNTPEEYSCRSGMITTAPSFNFEYGYVQMVARLPYGAGLWPAFWLAASDDAWPPEVDIFEHWGSQASAGVYLHSTNGTRQGGRADGLSNLSQGWHTFTLSWTENKLTWYIDNNQVFSTTTGIPQQDMYIIANLANTSTAATSCSGSMLIKSIKVWQP